MPTTRRSSDPLDTQPTTPSGTVAIKDGLRRPVNVARQSDKSQTVQFNTSSDATTSHTMQHSTISQNTARRSIRQRTPSTRLQDMEVHFGGRKRPTGHSSLVCSSPAKMSKNVIKVPTLQATPHKSGLRMIKNADKDSDEQLEQSEEVDGSSDVMGEAVISTDKQDNGSKEVIGQGGSQRQGGPEEIERDSSQGQVEEIGQSGSQREDDEEIGQGGSQKHDSEEIGQGGSPKQDGKAIEQDVSQRQVDEEETGQGGSQRQVDEEETGQGGSQRQDEEETGQDGSQRQVDEEETGQGGSQRQDEEETGQDGSQRQDEEEETGQGGSQRQVDEETEQGGSQSQNEEEETGKGDSQRQNEEETGQGGNQRQVEEEIEQDWSQRQDGEKMKEMEQDGNPRRGHEEIQHGGNQRQVEVEMEQDCSQKPGGQQKRQDGNQRQVDEEIGQDGKQRQGGEEIRQNGSQGQGEEEMEQDGSQVQVEEEMEQDGEEIEQDGKQNQDEDGGNLTATKVYVVTPDNTLVASSGAALTKIATGRSKIDAQPGQDIEGVVREKAANEPSKGEPETVVVLQDGQQLVFCVENEDVVVRKVLDYADLKPLNPADNDGKGPSDSTSNDEAVDSNTMIKSEPSEKTSNIKHSSNLSPHAELSVKFVTVNSPPPPLSEGATKPTTQHITTTAQGSSLHVAMDGQGQLQDDFMGPIVLPNGHFACSHCSYKTDKRPNWYKHKRKHIGGKVYTCNECGQTMSSSSNLKRHLMIHSDTRTFKCDQCNLMFRQKIHLERHIKYKHEVKQVKCEYCDYTCANENPDLKMHLKRKHVLNSDNKEVIEDSNFRCEDCGFIAASKRDLVQHMKFHKQGPELKLYCELCSFVTDCASRLHRHHRIHSKEKPFQCGYCDYRATQKAHVLRHMQSKHDVDVPNPRVYNRKSMDAALNVLHVLPSSLIRKKKKYLPADFSSREKVFSCAHCTMRFAKLINLYKHLKVQHKELHMPGDDGMHSCVICEYRTSKKKNLLIHMRKHNVRDTDTDPSHTFTCVFCNYSNNKRKNLYTHMRKKHKMHIIIKQDGSASCVIDNEIGGMNLDEAGELEAVATVTSAMLDESPVIQAVEETDAIEIEPTPSTSTSSTQMVMVELEPGMPATAVEIALPHHDTNPHMDLEAADAIEGLQALADQVTEVLPDSDQSAIVAHSAAQPSTSDMVQSNIQLSEDQLMHLSSGDFIQINGEMYKVEFSE